MEPLKNLYSISFYEKFCQIIQTFIPDFKSENFLNLIFDEQWEKRELKARMKHTTTVLHGFLLNNFEENASLLADLSIKLKREGCTNQGLQYMFLPDYIEAYGLDHFEASTIAFEVLTQFTSCEFAVRPFIVKYPEKMTNKMVEWSKHGNHHVRRLASEGSRPRLPWAMALPDFKKNPEPILPILENLKQDSSEYVRRSVANNLNDIIKDNPEVVLRIMKKWSGLGKDTDYILKHGCRTLLKSGHAEALSHFGLLTNELLEISDFNLDQTELKIGEVLGFSFALHNASKKSEKVRLEYGVHFLRSNGTWSKKVFKISEKELTASEQIKVKRHHSFRLITTKVYYSGMQYFSLIVNGEERLKVGFNLL